MSQFKKFAHNQIKSLIGHLEDYKEQKDPELLHKIRVDIKKIKATLKMTGECDKSFKAHKNFIPFRTIFRRSGEIREPEVLTGLLLEHNVAGVHDQSIDQNNEKLVMRFRHDVPKFTATVKEQWHKLKPALKQVRKKRIEKYLQKLKKDIKSKLYPKPSIRLIHKVRKSIKEFVYLSEGAFHSNKKLSLFYSREAEAIGRLHDRQVLLALLNKKNGSADKTVVRKIKTECTLIKKEIVQTASKFYN